MNRFYVQFLIFTFALMTIAVTAAPINGEVFREKGIVKYVPKLKFDASLTAPEWEKVPAFKFKKTVTHLDEVGMLPTEEAEVKFLYDDQYLYVGVKLKDSDIVDQGKKSQTHLYLTGDLVELFIKPKHHNYYWEIYGTPKKFNTIFYYPSRGRISTGAFTTSTKVKIRVDSYINGTLNDHQNRDHSWNALLGIPLSELCKNGLKFINSEEWTIFVSRYNYSRYLLDLEFSSFPQILFNFHLTEYYAVLKIEPKRQGK